MKRTLIIGALCALLAPAQQNGNEFEVASIRPANPDATGTRFQVRPGVFLVTNATLRQLITDAYDVRDFQITGGQSWVGTQRFDITAKMNEDIDPAKLSQQELLSARERVNERVRNLLIERFHLQVRREMQEQSVYALTVAKTGSKLAAPAEGSKRGLSFRGTNGRMEVTAASTAMDFFVRSLAGVLGRPVVDRTGLTGLYAFKAQWAQERERIPTAPDATPAGPALDDGPTIFTALQEQLGLRLESTRAPAEVLIIERAEKPSEN